MTSKPAGPREIWAWCMYDFANSSFSTLIVTVAYSVYFVQVVAGQVTPDGSAERLWFRGYAVSMLVVAFLAPALGALADARAAKRAFLIASTMICVLCTALLAFVQAGDIWMGLVLFGLANIAFDLGFLFYSAFLVELATPERMGRVSGYGWGLGYVGGLLSLAIAYPFISGGFAADNLSTYRVSFAVTAAFFFLAALPTFFILRERAVPQPRRAGESVWAQGFKRLSSTARHVKQHRDLFVYLIAYLFYTDGINTVIVVSAIFASKVLDFSPSDLIIYFSITQVTAGLGSLAFGLLADRIGAKRTINLTLGIWILVVCAAALVQTHAQFYAIGLVAGSVLGANQATSRSLLAQFTPIGKQGEFFSFFSVTGKFAALLGPLVYGEVTAWTGNQRWAVLSIAVFLIIGLLAFQAVDQERGIAAARRLES